MPSRQLNPHKQKSRPCGSVTAPHLGERTAAPGAIGELAARGVVRTLGLLIRTDNCPHPPLEPHRWQQGGEEETRMNTTPNKSIYCWTNDLQTRSNSSMWSLQVICMSDESLSIQESTTNKCFGWSGIQKLKKMLICVFKMFHFMPSAQWICETESTFTQNQDLLVWRWNILFLSD